MASMSTSGNTPPAVPGGGKPNPFAKKKGKGKAAAPAGNPFAKKGAAPAGKGKPLDPKTLGSMKDSLK